MTPHSLMLQAMIHLFMNQQGMKESLVEEMNNVVLSSSIQSKSPSPSKKVFAR